MERIMCEKIGSGGGRRGGWRAEGGAREANRGPRLRRAAYLAYPFEQYWSSVITIYDGLWIVGIQASSTTIAQSDLKRGMWRYVTTALGGP